MALHPLGTQPNLILQLPMRATTVLFPHSAGAVFMQLTGAVALRHTDHPHPPTPGLMLIQEQKSMSFLGFLRRALCPHWIAELIRTPGSLAVLGTCMGGLGGRLSG